jgi:hypothetical protein
MKNINNAQDVTPYRFKKQISRMRDGCLSQLCPAVAQISVKVCAKLIWNEGPKVAVLYIEPA